MRLHSALASMLFLAAILPAQGEKTKIGTKDYRAKLQKRVIKMRDAMRAGQVRKYNVYVSIRLKNNNKLKGVVKDGRFIEAQDGLDFVAADRRRRNSGLRIWFSAGTNSFIFVPYESIAFYKIGRTLSDDQIKGIERDLVTKRESVREKYRRLAAARKMAAAKLAAEKAVAQTGSQPATPALPQLTAAQKALLAEFPPAEGWGESKIARLKLRRVSVGVYPNKMEKKFEDNYADWAKAFAAQEKLAAAALAAKKAANADKTKSVGQAGAPGGKPGRTTALPVSGVITPPKVGAIPPMPGSGR